MFGWNNIRTKTLSVIFKVIVIFLLLVSSFSFSILFYLYTFNRVTLPVGVLYLFGLVQLPVGLLLSVDYTPLGIIWEGLLVISTNSDLRLMLNFLLLMPLLLVFILSPIGLVINLRKINGYENIGEGIEGFKSRIWGTKEGKRIVILMEMSSAIIYVCIFFIFLSGFYIIRQNFLLIAALLIFEFINIHINSRIQKRYRRILDQKLQVKQDNIKPKNT